MQTESSTSARSLKEFVVRIATERRNSIETLQRDASLETLMNCIKNLGLLVQGITFLCVSVRQGTEARVYAMGDLSFAVIGTSVRLWAEFTDEETGKTYSAFDIRNITNLVTLAEAIEDPIEWRLQKPEPSEAAQVVSALERIEKQFDRMAYAIEVMR